MFGGAKDFCPNFRNLPETFWATLPTNFFPSKIMKTFFGMTSKKRPSRVFLQRLAPFYEIKQGWLAHNFRNSSVRV